MSALFYDRVKILVDGIPYLPNGSIKTFRMAATYKSSQVMGFTPDGKPAGQIVGSSVIDNITWSEYLPTQSNYINWRTFLIANPDSVVTIIPFGLASGADNSPQFTITGLNCTGQVESFPGESEAGVRDITFNAGSSSNL